MVQLTAPVEHPEGVPELEPPVVKVVSLVLGNVRYWVSCVSVRLLDWVRWLVS